MREGEDPSLPADPASNRRQVWAEKFHHLAASQANLASLTLGREAESLPAILVGAEQGNCLQGPLPGAGPLNRREGCSGS